MHNRPILSTALFFFLVFISFNAVSQSKPKKVTLFSKNGIVVEIQISPSKNPCGINPRNSTYEIYLTNKNNLYPINQYLTWKMDIVNCNNLIVRRVFNINLTDLNEGMNKLKDWTFEGNEIEQMPFDVENLSYETNLKETIIGKNQSVKPIYFSCFCSRWINYRVF